MRTPKHKKFLRASVAFGLTVAGAIGLSQLNPIDVSDLSKSLPWVDRSEVRIPAQRDPVADLNYFGGSQITRSRGAGYPTRSSRYGGMFGLRPDQVTSQPIEIEVERDDNDPEKVVLKGGVQKICLAEENPDAGVSISIDQKVHPKHKNNPEWKLIEINLHWEGNENPTSRRNRGRHLRGRSFLLGNEFQEDLSATCGCRPTSSNGSWCRSIQSVAKNKGDLKLDDLRWADFEIVKSWPGGEETVSTGFRWRSQSQRLVDAVATCESTYGVLRPLKTLARITGQGNAFMKNLIAWHAFTQGNLRGDIKAARSEQRLAIMEDIVDIMEARAGGDAAREEMVDEARRLIINQRAFIKRNSMEELRRMLRGANSIEELLAVRETIMEFINENGLDKSSKEYAVVKDFSRKLRTMVTKTLNESDIEDLNQAVGDMMFVADGFPHELPYVTRAVMNKIKRSIRDAKNEEDLDEVKETLQAFHDTYEGKSKYDEDLYIANRAALAGRRLAIVEKSGDGFEVREGMERVYDELDELEDEEGANSTQISRIKNRISLRIAQTEARQHVAGASIASETLGPQFALSMASQGIRTSFLPMIEEQYEDYMDSCLGSVGGYGSFLGSGSLGLSDLWGSSVEDTIRCNNARQGLMQAQQAQTSTLAGAQQAVMRRSQAMLGRGRSGIGGLPGMGYPQMGGLPYGASPYGASPYGATPYGAYPFTASPYATPFINQAGGLPYGAAGAFNPAIGLNPGLMFGNGVRPGFNTVISPYATGAFGGSPVF